MSAIKILLAATAMSAAAPAFAQAADPVSWTGFYVGGRAGYSFQPGDGSERLLFDRNGDGRFGDTVRTAAGADAFSPGFCGGTARGAQAATGCTKDKDSLEFALHAGYDFDLGKVVLGVIAEGGIGYAEDAVTGFSTTPASYTWTRRMRQNASFRARAGYALGADRKTLVYGTGGIVIAKMENRWRSSNRANGYTDTSDTSVTGWRAGAGVERQVHKHLTIGVQYLHTSLKDDGARLRITQGSQPATNPFILTGAAYPGGTTYTDVARSHSRFVTDNVSATASIRF